VTDPSASPSFLSVGSVAASRYNGEIFRDSSPIHSEFIALFLNAAMKTGAAEPPQPRRSKESSPKRKEGTSTKHPAGGARELGSHKQLDGYS
jgi:hypothetical protein